MGASQVLEISKPSQIETPIEAGAARLEERTEAGALVDVPPVHPSPAFRKKIKHTLRVSSS